MVRRLAAIVFTALVIGIVLVGTIHAQGQDDFAHLLGDIRTLHDQGNYAEAVPIAERLVSIARKRYGAEHPEFATALVWLGLVYSGQGRFAEAEQLFKQSIIIRETALGTDHPDVGTSLNNLGDVYLAQNRHAEAEPLAKRSLVIWEKALGAEHPAVGTSLNNLAQLYRAQSRYAEAEPIAKRSLAIWEKALGPTHPDVGKALSNLALIFEGQSRFAEAEPLYKRSLTISEQSLGPNHPAVGTSLNNLAELYRAQGRYSEAEPLLRRSLAIWERALGTDHPSVGTSLNNLAELHRVQGRYAEAEPLYRRALAIWEARLGGDHPAVSRALNNLALLYGVQGRYGEAEPLYKRSLAISEKVLGPDNSLVGTILNNLGELYRAQGQYAEAEALYTRAFAVAEKTLGPNHPILGLRLSNLAALYLTQGRYAEAEPFAKRSLAIWEKALGPDHPSVATALINLSELYREQGRYAEGEALARRSLAIREKTLSPDHPDVGLSLNNLAAFYLPQGRWWEAEVLFERSLTIRQKSLGMDHPDVGQALNNLAGVYRKQRRYLEAEQLYKTSLSIREKALGLHHPDVGASVGNLAGLLAEAGRVPEASSLRQRERSIMETAFGPDHPNVSIALNNLAVLHLEQGQWAQAADYWRHSVGIITRRTARGLTRGRGERSTESEAQRLASRFWALVKTTHRLPRDGPSATTAAPASEMFEMAQWAHGSAAAASLTQMSTRSAKGVPWLARLVRERQDLVSEWDVKDKLLIATKSEPPVKRNADAEKALADRLAAIDVRLAEIDQWLTRDFPDYAALASPAPLSVAGVRAQLGPDEALVLFLDTDDWLRPLPEETFIWVVAKEGVRWVRSELGTAALTREVTALRCGLDATAWSGEGAEKCMNALSIPRDKAPGSNQPLPFDHARAHKLYAALFGEVQDLIKGKHLLIVPSGPLTQLPFQVLVTRPPTSGAHRSVAWLAREHAVTVLPAVSSLKALRRVGKPSAAARPMVGFGNPLLDGPDTRYADRAKLARQKQRCPETPLARLAAFARLGEGMTRVETRGGLANVSHIKAQVPLPETADELCAVAQDVKAEGNDIRLGAQATEREVKRLSAGGEMAKYRMVHLATHGYLAGQLDGAKEPGLLLTPPDNATEEDDGYLSASEIASLKLDADWVILSACNTAAGAATSAEALSGLARAFIYAGTRALLVSHWEVYSDATVKLITAALREMARDPKVGRAEAMRRSMLALIDKGQPHEAHPAYWAPFVVVGEGAAGR